jgi:DNA-binding MarR family transcriptional regulator
MDNRELYRALREVFVLLEFGNYEALRPYQLDNIEYSALQLLALETGWRMVDLRERLICDKSKVTRIIDHFEDRGLAQRQPDPEDRRAWKVFLTPAGLQLRKQAQTAFQEALDISFSSIAPEDQEQLFSLLEILRTHLLTLKNQG